MQYKYSYNGFEYQFEDDPKRITITDLSSPLIPETLSKYYSINRHSIEAIENHHFYVSQPDDFNDLFDTSELLMDFNNITVDDVLNFAENPTENAKLDLSELYQDHRDEFLRIFKGAYYNRLFIHIGLLCLTPNTDDEIMWGYYNNHEGFCITFDYTKFGSGYYGPLPMNYVEELKSFDIHSHHGMIAFLLQTTIKKNKWKHENEYRFIVDAYPNVFETHGQYSHSDIDKYNNSIGRSLPFVPRIADYPHTAIKNITLGFKFVKDLQPLHTADNSYTLTFNYSCQHLLKKRLLDVIINQGIECYLVMQDTEKFSIGMQKVIVSKMTENEYTMTLINTIN